MLRSLHSTPDNEFEVKTQLEGSSIPPLACEYCPNEARCQLAAIADEEGGVNIYGHDACTGRMKRVQSWLAHENAVFDVAWCPKRDEMLTASGDLSISLWDVSSRKCLRDFCGHDASVKCVRYAPDSPGVFASGSRDGDILVWDSRVPGPAMVIARSHQMSSVTSSAPSKKRAKTQPVKVVSPSISVTDCVFQGDYNLISCGATNSVIKVWDLRKNYRLFRNDPKPVHVFPYAGQSAAVHGYSSLALDPCGTSVYANCTDNCIYRFNVSTYALEPISVYYGHRVRTFYIKLSLSLDGCFLLSGSADQMAYIWNVDKPGYPFLQLEGHTAEVTSISWNKFDLGKVVTCGDDNKVIFWDCASREGMLPGCPNQCSPFAPSETTPKPRWSTPGIRTPTTPRSAQQPRSVVDWLTPPTKRRLVAETSPRLDNELLRTPENPTQMSESCRINTGSYSDPLGTPGPSRHQVLSPQKVDNLPNLPQRRLLLSLDFGEEKKHAVEEDGENACIQDMKAPKGHVTPPKSAAKPCPAPSAQRSKKDHKVKMRLFNRASRNKKTKAKRELIHTRTIISFFKR